MTWDPGSQNTHNSQNNNLNNPPSERKVYYSEMNKHRSVELDDILEESSIEEESCSACG